MDKVQSLLETRLWYRLKPEIQAEYLEGPGAMPGRLYRIWYRLDEEERQRFREKAGYADRSKTT